MVEDVKAARLLRLREILVNDYAGNVQALANALTMKRPQVARWVTPNDQVRQGISEDSARAIEAKLGKPFGLLDQQPNAEREIHAEFAWIWQNSTDEGKAFIRNVLALVERNFTQRSGGEAPPELFVVERRRGLTDNQ